MTWWKNWGQCVFENWEKNLAESLYYGTIGLAFLILILIGCWESRLFRTGTLCVISSLIGLGLFFSPVAPARSIRKKRLIGLPTLFSLAALLLVGVKFCYDALHVLL